MRKGNPERNNPKRLNGEKKNQLRFRIVSKSNVEITTTNITGRMDLSQNIA